MKKVAKLALATIEDSIRHNQYESVHVIDAEGNLVYENLNGKKTTHGDSVYIGDAGNLEGFILTHNHPMDSDRANHSLSDGDVKVLCNFNLSEVRAVTRSFNHSISLKSPCEYKDMIATITYITKQMDKEIKLNYELNGIDSFPFEDYNHELWTRASKVIDNLKYKRTPIKLWT